MMIYRIYCYSNHGQPYGEVACFFALKRIANYDYLLFPI